MIIPGITSTDPVDDAILRGLVDRRIEVEGPDFDYADESLVGYARSVRAALERAGLLMPAGAEVREEWGVRWDWNDRDREPIVDWYRDRAMAEGERDRPYREFSATLIRRLHLTLPAEVVDER